MKEIVETSAQVEGTPSQSLFSLSSGLLLNNIAISCEEKGSLQPQPHSNTKDTKPSKWEDYRVHAGEYIAEDEPLLKIGEHTIVSRENIQTISGKPKSCKTFLTSAMAGACISGKYLGMTTPQKNLKVLMFDTEQGRARAQKVQRRVYRICGSKYEEESDRLTVVSVRELDPAKRIEILKKAMNDTKPDLVLIDGVRDLLVDFNDIKESATLVNMLMQLSVDFSCAIVAVIHQNKGDVNARGHLGSELMNKSETAMEAQRADKISTVRPVYCRNIEFNEFSFRINADGLPELCDAPINSKRENSLEVLERHIVKAMFGSSQILRAELRKKLEDATGLTERTANRKISEAIANGIIEVMPNDKKMVRLIVELDDDTDDDYSLPF